MQSGPSQRRLHWCRRMLGRACGQAQQRGWQSLNPRHPLTTSGLEPEQQDPAVAASQHAEQVAQASVGQPPLQVELLWHHHRHHHHHGEANRVALDGWQMQWPRQWSPALPELRLPPGW